MKPNDEVVPIEVYAWTTWQAEMVKSILNDSEIESFLSDGIMGTLNPWWTAPGGAGSVRVFVSSLDSVRAKLVVAEFQKNLDSESAPDEDLT